MKSRIVLSILLMFMSAACILDADDAGDELHDGVLWSEVGPDAAEGIGTSPDPADAVCVWWPNNPMPACIWTCCFMDIVPKPCCPISTCKDCTSAVPETEESIVPPICYPGAPPPCPDWPAPCPPPLVRSPTGACVPLPADPWPKPPPP